MNTGHGKLLCKEVSGHAVLRYTYHPDGNVKTMTDGSGRVLFYGYDHGGRLISVADEAGEIVGYCHTPGGKVKEIRHRNGVRTAYEYDTEGNIIRLLTETRDGGTICDLRYAYDLNGDRTAKKGTMLLPDHPGGLSEQIRDIRYRYDSMDRLTVNGKKSTFLYGGGDLYAESDGTGEDVIRYIWGYGLAGLGYQGKLYGVHRDEQLSTGWITGGEGGPENAYEYDAFGVLLGSYGKVPGRLLYGGQQYDAEMEQYYLRARYYNPMIGRFMQEDTYRGDGLNLYAYCANNPVMYYDPSGYGSDHNVDAEGNTQRENVTSEGENGHKNNIDEGYPLYRQKANAGKFSKLKEPMTIEHVK